MDVFGTFGLHCHEDTATLHICCFRYGSHRRGFCPHVNLFVLILLLNLYKHRCHSLRLLAAIDHPCSTYAFPLPLSYAYAHQALGFIFIARPQLAVSVRDVGPVLERALDRSQPPSIKARCLTSLTELLRSEEDSIVARQKEAKREDEAAQQASTLPNAEVRELARRNGEGDTSSVSSGIIQASLAACFLRSANLLSFAVESTSSHVGAKIGGT